MQPSVMPETLNDEPARQPTPPFELWMLWGGRAWVRSVDGCPGGRTCLAAFNEAEAHAAAAHQEETYGVECHPVRVL